MKVQSTEKRSLHSTYPILNTSRSSTYPIDEKTSINPMYLTSNGFKSKKNIHINIIHNENTNYKKNIKYPGDDLILIHKCFPNFPLKYLFYLFYRNDGNTYFVYKTLRQNGWKSFDKSISKKYFTNANDNHLLIPYYHGKYPGIEYCSTLLLNSKDGSFITYYKEIDSIALLYEYYICFKHISGKIIEKSMPSFEIPLNVQILLNLSSGIKDKRQKTIEYIPFLQNRIESK